jgi:hypothetical protein
METTEFDLNRDYKKTRECSHPHPLYRLRNDCPIKVNKKLAQEILMNDITVTKLGAVRYLQLKHLGLGIHEVRILPEGMKQTRLVKSFY